VTIHLQRFGHEQLDSIETTRVTLLEDGTSLGIVGRVLVLGVKPNFKLIPFSEVQWFWVED
jgi:hypothetical protein